MSLKFKSVVIVYVRERGAVASSFGCLFSVESSRVRMWKASFVVLAALVAVAAAAVGSMVGAPVEINVNDERVQNAINFAVGEHNKGTNDMFLRGVDEVLHATGQVCNALLFGPITTIYIY